MNFKCVIRVNFKDFRMFLFLSTQYEILLIHYSSAQMKKKAVNFSDIPSSFKTSNCTKKGMLLVLIKLHYEILSYAI